MKLYVVLFFIALSQVHASSKAQTVTLKGVDMSLQKVFSHLEKQTGYTVLGQKNMFQDTHRVSFDVKSMGLIPFLNLLLKNQPLSYHIEEKNIVLLRKREVAQAPVSSPTTAVARSKAIAFEVTGMILDTSGKRLHGVSILEKGTTNGTSSRADGTFSITVKSENAVLVFSYLGFVTQEIKSTAKMVVILKNQDSQLDQVIVVGYGEQSKRSFAGSVSTIDSEVLERTPAATLDLKLQGQAAGVMVTNTSAEPGGNVSIRIRGSNSISGNNEPLYVVDGYPLPPGGEASGTDRTQNSNFLSGINPDDIINIQILKDASATAIYGSRGANGVVIITTRQGKEGTGKVDVSYRASLSSIFNVPRMLNLADYALLQNQFAASQGNTNLPFNGESEYRPKPEDAGPLHVNWVDVITRNAINHNAQVNFSGGRAGTTYMLSANYISEDGVVKYTGFKRGSVRLNLQTRILPGLNAQTNISITRSDNNRRSTGSGNINAADGMFQALRAAPIMRAAEFEDFMDDVERIQFNNPLIELADRKDLTTNTDVLVNTLLKANIVKSLTFFTRVGVTMRNSDKEQYSKKTTWRGYLSNGLASVTAFNNINFLLEPYLQYNNGLGNAGRINVTLGGTFQRDISKRRGAVVNDFPFDDFTTDNLGLGLNRSATTSSKSTRQLISAYTRIHYDLRNKYILTLTARQDGSSVFATSKKWAMFPSAAVAWNVKREGFMQQAGFLNELKLRASYGLTGNQSIPELGSITRLGSANYNFGTTEYAGFAPAAQFGNPDLRWETTRQMNVGADVEIIKSKIAFTIEYFNKKTVDLLQSQRLSPTTGYATSLKNIGAIENKGWEFTTNMDLLKGKLNWNLSANLTAYKSRVVDLGGLNEILGSAPLVSIVSSPSNTMRVGYPFASFVGFVNDGLINLSDFEGGVTTGKPLFVPWNGETRLGQWKIKDMDGNGVISEADKQIIGNPNPDFYFGFTNNLSYKNFNLSVFFQGVMGQEVMNLASLFLNSGPAQGNKTQEWYEKKWTAENPHNDPRYPDLWVLQANMQPMSSIVEDASFVRLKNVTLSYNFQFKKKMVRSAQVYFTGVNLLTFTGYSGMDPEVNIFGQNNIMQGLDFGAYPRSRTLIVGFRMGL